MPHKASPLEEIVARQHESGRIQCPECSKDRKKSHLETLSITVHPHEILYKCHHCDAAGVVEPEHLNIPHLKTGKKKHLVAQIPTRLNDDKDAIRAFFSNRGIALGDLSKVPPLTTGTRFFHGLGKVPAIGFIYGSRTQPDAIKWRAMDRKAFTQENAARSFYGLELLPENPKEIIIVEGEADAVALASIGVTAISCPNGAPMKVSNGKISPEEDAKFSYIWESRQIFDNAERIVLACDGDSAGDALTEELARRIDRARCYRVEYPEGCKDITDVIREHGGPAAKELLDKAPEMPLAGVYSAKDYAPQLEKIYEEGVGSGESTGYDNLDELWTVKPGQLTVITGLPSSGKSEFVDQIMVNLAQNASWKFAIASFENPPSYHIAKLAEKIIKKPFFEGPTPRMREDELHEATDFINKHFVFLESKDGSMSTIESIIKRCKQAIMRLGVRGLVIDPFNYLDLGRNEHEHQAISDMLTKITAFAKAHDIHILFVAHPAKIYPRDDGSYPIPKGMHVSGSSAWFSKTDVGLTVHRVSGAVEIHNWKCRFKWVGQQGKATLYFNPVNGCYSAAQVPNETTSPVKKSDYENIDYDNLDF